MVRGAEVIPPGPERGMSGGTAFRFHAAVREVMALFARNCEQGQVFLRGSAQISVSCPVPRPVRIYKH